MEKIPFARYDFLGYLAAGLLSVAGSELVFGYPQFIGHDLTIYDSALLLLAIYLIGHVIAVPAKGLLEDLFVGRALGRPSELLFATGRRGLARFFFPGYLRSLPPSIREKVQRKASAEATSVSGEALFLCARYADAIVRNEPVQQRLTMFVSLYGFSRNMSFVSLALAGCAAGRFIIFDEAFQVRNVLLFGVAGLMLFYRYLKFFRQYSFELFNAYGGLGGGTQNL